MTSNKEKGFGDLVAGVVEGIKPEGAFYERMAQGASVPYGFKEVDHCLHGVWPGDLACVLSAPSVGRSAFVQQVALNAALAGAHVDYFTLEADAKQVATRLLSSYSRVATTKILDGFVTDSDIVALEEARGKLAGLSLNVYDDHRMSLEDICEEAERHVGGLDGKHLVVVDGTERLASSEGCRDVGDAALRLKRLARDMDVAVLMTVCVRGKDARACRRKKAWTGSIMDLVPDVAAVADEVLMVDRSLDELEACLSGAPELNCMEVSVAKNRRGYQRSITLAFIPEYAKILDFVDDRYY